MEKKTTQRIIGILIAIALVIILLPLLFVKRDDPQTAAMNEPAFPDQQSSPSTSTDAAPLPADQKPSPMASNDTIPQNNSVPNQQSLVQAIDSPKIKTVEQSGAQSTEQQKSSEKSADQAIPEQQAPGMTAEAKSDLNATTTPAMADEQLPGAKTSEKAVIQTNQQTTTTKAVEQVVDHPEQSAALPSEQAVANVAANSVIETQQPSVIHQEKQAAEGKEQIANKSQSKQLEQLAYKSQSKHSEPLTDKLQSQHSEQLTNKAESKHPEQVQDKLQSKHPEQVADKSQAQQQQQQQQLQPQQQPQQNEPQSQQFSIISDTNKKEAVTSIDIKPGVVEEVQEMPTAHVEVNNHSVDKQVKTTSLSTKEKQLINLKKTAWAIQLGSFKDKNNARRLADRLRAAGYKAFTREIQSKKGSDVQTRVYIGPEYKQASALKLSTQLAEQMKIHGFIVPYKPLEL